ncbi:MAG: PH domain-containing protein [Phycisphaerae bacterium]|nr:PH domain-containing protein [Phycisphaerae bacterium]
MAAVLCAACVAAGLVIPIEGAHRFMVWFTPQACIANVAVWMGLLGIYGCLTMTCGRSIDRHGIVLRSFFRTRRVAWSNIRRVTLWQGVRSPALLCFEHTDGVCEIIDRCLRDGRRPTRDLVRKYWTRGDIVNVERLGPDKRAAIRPVQPPPSVLRCLVIGGCVTAAVYGLNLLLRVELTGGPGPQPTWLQTLLPPTVAAGFWLIGTLGYYAVSIWPRRMAIRWKDEGVIGRLREVSRLARVWEAAEKRGYQILLVAPPLAALFVSAIIIPLKFAGYLSWSEWAFVLFAVLMWCYVAFVAGYAALWNMIGWLMPGEKGPTPRCLLPRLHDILTPEEMAEAAPRIRRALRNRGRAFLAVWLVASIALAVAFWSAVKHLQVQAIEPVYDSRGWARWLIVGIILGLSVALASVHFRTKRRLGKDWSVYRRFVHTERRAQSEGYLVLAVIVGLFGLFCGGLPWRQVTLIDQQGIGSEKAIYQVAQRSFEEVAEVTLERKPQRGLFSTGSYGCLCIRFTDGDMVLMRTDRDDCDRGDLERIAKFVGQRSGVKPRGQL